MGESEEQARRLHVLFPVPPELGVRGSDRGLLLTWDVVIPAGGAIDAAYAQTIGSPYRPLAPLGPANTPVLQHIVDTLRACERIGRIIGVAPKAVSSVINGVDLWLAAGDSGTDNIRAGLAEATPGRPALVCASDLPLLTPGSIHDFLAACQPDAEVAVGLVRADDYNAAFSDAPPSEFVRLADAGPVTLSGVFLVHPDLLVRHEALFRRMFGSRKEQWRMAGLLGPRLLWQFATKTLRLRDIVARAEDILGGPVQVVEGVAPALAYDIDNHDDYTYARTRSAGPHG